MNAGGSVVIAARPPQSMSPGAGSITREAWVQTTKKLISGGPYLAISRKRPRISFTPGFSMGGLPQTMRKWGVKETFGTPLLGGPYYETGYIQGGNGGAISITAPSVALDGNLVGNTVAGPRQRAIGPESSSLSLIFQAQNTSSTSYIPYSPTPPDITFQPGVITVAAVAPFSLDSLGNPLPLPVSRQEEVILSPDLVNTDGFGVLTINNSDGNIVVPANVALSTPIGLSSLARNSSGATVELYGGDITLSGANIDIEGKLTAPGGNLSFSVYDISPYAQILTTPTVDSTRGVFTLGASASLDTTGLVVDDRLCRVQRHTACRSRPRAGQLRLTVTAPF